MRETFVPTHERSKLETTSPRYTYEALRGLRYIQHLSFEEDECGFTVKVFSSKLYSQDPGYVERFKEDASEDKSVRIWKCAYAWEKERRKEKKTSTEMRLRIPFFKFEIGSSAIS